MVIIFQNRQVLDHLLKTGEVYTYRRAPKRLGRDWATDRRCGKKVADVYIHLIAKVTRESIPEELDKVSPQSGLNTVESWMQAIENLNRGEVPEAGWLYHVVLVPHSQSSVVWRGMAVPITTTGELL